MSRHVANAVQAQADRWFARRQTPAFAASAADRAEFERWLAAHPGHRRAYATTEALWGELGELRQDDELAALARAAEHAPPASPRWRPWLAAAALAAVAVAGTLLLRPLLFPAPQAATYATGVGERRSVTLADGSALTLNTDTEVTARFTRHQRELTLQHGEALFQVRHDAQRPFVVAAEDGTVTALGTRFQVRRTGGAVTVTLLEGRVAVARDAAGERRVLQPGEQAGYQAGTAGIAHGRVDVEAATLWTTGSLSFRETPLPQAVAEVNRYATRKLAVDPALADITVSGTFGTDEPDAFVAALEAMFPIRAVRRDDGGEVRLVPKP